MQRDTKEKRIKREEEVDSIYFIRITGLEEESLGEEWVHCSLSIIKIKNYMYQALTPKAYHFLFHLAKFSHTLDLACIALPFL